MYFTLLTGWLNTEFFPYSEDYIDISIFLKEFYKKFSKYWTTFLSVPALGNCYLFIVSLKKEIVIRARVQYFKRVVICWHSPPWIKNHENEFKSEINVSFTFIALPQSEFGHYGPFLDMRVHFLTPASVFGH